MPRRPKASQPVAMSAGAVPGVARGTKTAAVQAALQAHPEKRPREIAELLQAQGWDMKPSQVSVIKSNMLRRPPKTKVTAPAKASGAAPAARQDAISLGSLQRAKELATQLGGIKQAKAAMDALSQLIG